MEKYWPHWTTFDLPGNEIMKQVIYLGAEEGFEATQQALAGAADVMHVAAEPEKVADALREADGLLDASMKVKLTPEMLAAAAEAEDHLLRHHWIRSHCARRP